jgi:hypothetical protein
MLSVAFQPAKPAATDLLARLPETAAWPDAATILFSFALFVGPSSGPAIQAPAKPLEIAAFYMAPSRTPRSGAIWGIAGGDGERSGNLKTSSFAYFGGIYYNSSEIPNRATLKSFQQIILDHYMGVSEVIYF